MWTIYEKPTIYLIIHIFIGFISVYIPGLLGLFIAYQGLQLTLGQRFFFFEGTREDGNSVAHTGIKLIEGFVGYAIGETFVAFASVFASA